MASRPCPLPFDIWWFHLASLAPFEEVVRLLCSVRSRMLSRALLKGYREWRGRVDQLPLGGNPNAHQFVKRVYLFPDLLETEMDLSLVAHAFPRCEARFFDFSLRWGFGW